MAGIFEKVRTVLTGLSIVPISAHADIRIYVDVDTGASVVARRTDTGHPRCCNK